MRNPLHYGLPKRLKQARKASQYTAARLATEAGLSDRTAVYGIENGSRIPRIDTVERLANVLGLSPGWLAYGLGEPHETAASDPLRADGCGARLRETRTLQGQSVRELGRQSVSSDTTVRLTERGETIPNVATIEHLAGALFVSPAWLGFGVGTSEWTGPGSCRPSAAQR